MNLRPIFLAYQTDTNMTSNPRDYITHCVHTESNRTEPDRSESGGERERERERERETGARPQIDDEEDDEEGDDDSSRGVSEPLHLLLQPE